MSEHRATIEWTLTSAEFTYATYNRDHTWRFDGGTSVRASAAPAYKGDPALVDPEEAFVAALSSCHMLTFLALATKGGHVVRRYRDEAVGHMAKRADGRMAVVKVELHPEIEFGAGKAPNAEQLKTLHHHAHEQCFIANSVTTEVVVVD